MMNLTEESIFKEVFGKLYKVVTKHSILNIIPKFKRGFMGISCFDIDYKLGDLLVKDQGRGLSFI